MKLLTVTKCNKPVPGTFAVQAHAKEPFAKEGGTARGSVNSATDCENLRAAYGRTNNAN